MQGIPKEEKITQFWSEIREKGNQQNEDVEWIAKEDGTRQSMQLLGKKIQALHPYIATALTEILQHSTQLPHWIT